MILRKIFSLPTLVLLTAISLSVIAAWYSILGLTAIFAAAVMPIIIMGSALEFAKVVTTVWLHRFWYKASWKLKLYLVPAVMMLAFLTSLGVFGYLSKSHSDQTLISGDVAAKIAIYDEKIKNERDNIEASRKSLKQLDDAVDQVMTRSNDEKGADKSNKIRTAQQKDRIRIQSEITDSQTRISKLNDERAPIAAEIRKTEADVGPIKYIAALIYGDNPDSNLLERAVRWVIIIIVFVFDPLALTLVIAATSSYAWLDDDVDEAGDNEINYIGNDKLKTNLDSVNTDINYDIEEIPTKTSEEKLSDRVDEIWPEIRDMIAEDYNSNNPIVDTVDSDDIIDCVVDEDNKIIVLTDDCPKCGSPMVEYPMVGTYCINDECEDVNYDEQQRTDQENDIRPDEHLGEELLEEHFSNATEGVSEHDSQLESIENVSESQSAEIITEGVTLQEVGDGYINYAGKLTNRQALREIRPDLIGIGKTSQVSTSFGTEFPKVARIGNIFVRVDIQPNKVYKFDGNKWIEISKTQSDSYLYDEKYIQHLISKIELGEYDIELLSDTERNQIETYLNQQNA